jgi:succinyl-CoA synthetase beta subunit
MAVFGALYVGPVAEGERVLQPLRDFGAPVSNGAAVLDAHDALEAAQALGGPLWVVKAQIHAGGRGKGRFEGLKPESKGGVRVVRSIDEVKKKNKQYSEYLSRPNRFSAAEYIEKLKEVADKYQKVG